MQVNKKQANASKINTINFYMFRHVYNVDQ